MRTNSSILLIGSGRLALHLAHWNTLLQTPNHILKWDRSQSSARLQELLLQCSHVWLAISDTSIESFYKTYLTGHKVTHFSGALSVAGMQCAHPLMSFTPELFSKEIYHKIHFITEAPLQEILPGFSNSYTVLEERQKTFYHALCVLAGNFPQLLWTQVGHEMTRLNIPEQALDTYIGQITANYLQMKEKAVTGPLVRKDYVTVEKNLASLEKNKSLKNIYAAFAQEFLR